MTKAPPQLLPHFLTTYEEIWWFYDLGAKAWILKCVFSSEGDDIENHAQTFIFLFLYIFLVTAADDCYHTESLALFTQLKYIKRVLFRFS